MTNGIGWRDVKIGALGRVVTGKTPPSARPELFGEAHPFITPTDIDGVSRTVVTDRFIAEEGASAFKNQMIPGGAVCFVCIGATIGKMCIATRRSLTNQQVNSIVVDEALHDSKYVFYALRQIAPDVKGLAGGAATPIISKSSFSDISIRIAPLQQQRRIAAILSAYDDLIENNTRRIAILEEMGRRIYEEWFVRFRYPGNEGVRMVESELGSVPERWDVVRLDEVLVLQRGFDLPKQDRSDGQFPIISATGGSATHHECRVKGPGVVTGRSGSLGTVTYVESDFWPLNTTLWVKKFIVGSPLFSFYLLSTIDLAGFNSGAAVPTLNRNDVHGLSVLRPTPDVLAQFDEVALPIMKLKRRLELMSENLRTTRDLLLPKLISGELDVSALPLPEAIAA